MSHITARITRLDDVQPFTIDQAQFFPLSSPRIGGTELAVWQLRLQPGPAGAPHTIDREEVFVCLSGELLLEVDGEQSRLGPGHALAVPAGSRLAAAAGGAGARTGDADDQAGNQEDQVGDQDSGTAVALVCTRAGLSATMADGTILSPPWAS